MLRFLRGFLVLRFLEVGEFWVPVGEFWVPVGEDESDGITGNGINFFLSINGGKYILLLDTEPDTEPTSEENELLRPCGIFGFVLPVDGGSPFNSGSVLGGVTSPGTICGVFEAFLVFIYVAFRGLCYF